jgi:hypothetical protein
LNFDRDFEVNLAKHFGDFAGYMWKHKYRVAVLFSDKARGGLRPHYPKLVRDAVVYDNATQTIVVLTRGWARVPDFATKTRAAPAYVYSYDPASPDGVKKRVVNPPSAPPPKKK